MRSLMKSLANGIPHLFKNTRHATKCVLVITCSVLGVAAAQNSVTEYVVMVVAFDVLRLSLCCL